MGWIREFIAEWRARRRGHRHHTSTIARATRDITGPTGWVFSNAWDELDRNGEAYVRSFDRRLPPSTFVSERDRRRANLPMPLAERCIEDWTAQHAAPVETAEADPPPESGAQPRCTSS